MRRTVRAALDRGAPEEPPPPPSGDLSRLGLVTFDARGPLEGILRKLGQDAGARFDLPGGWRAREAEVHVESVPAFQAIEAIAESAGLDAGSSFDGAGLLRLREPAEGEEKVPSIALGPLRARVVRVATSRTLGSAARRRHALSLSLQWWPGVEVVSVRGLRVVAARTPDGKAYRSATPDTNVTYAIAPSAGSLEVTLALEPEDADAAERLAELEVAVVLRVRHARKWVRFAGLDRLPRSVTAPGDEAAGLEGGTVTLREARRPDAPQGPWVLEVAARLDGEVPGKSARLFLEEADGSAWPVNLTARSTTSDGTVLLTGRAHRGGGGGPAAARVAWFAREEEGEVRFALRDVPLR